jgi:hypothetical protein
VTIPKIAALTWRFEQTLLLCLEPTGAAKDLEDGS